MSHDLFWHAILLHMAKICWNRTIDCWGMSKKRFRRWQPSAILNFKHLLFLSRGLCWHCIPFRFLVQNFAEIGQSQSVDELWPKKRFSRWRPPPSWILKKSLFGHVTVIRFNICCSVPNFVKIGRFLSRVSTLTRDIDRPIAILSVRLSVRPWRPGIRWKLFNIIVIVFPPYGSTITLVLSASNIFTKFRRGHPLRGRKIQVGYKYPTCILGYKNFAIFYQ